MNCFDTLRRLVRNQRGQVLVLVAGGAAATVMVGGLAIDAGNLYGNHRDAANAADAAALAGGYELLAGKSNASASAAAQTWALKNGYSAGEITVNSPPASGPHAGDTAYVEVVVERDLPKYFIGLLYDGDWSASARAVAGVDLQVPPYSIIALNPTGCKAFNKTGTGNITLGSGIHVNSNCASDAMNVQGSTIISAGGVSVVGGLNVGGSAQINAPIYPASLIPDPYKDLDPPVFPSAAIPVRSNNPTVINGSGPVTLEPGVYRGGIRKNGSGSLTMNPGIYVMQGGGFDLQGSGPITAEGVMIYNTCSTGNCAVGGSSGAISISASGDITMTPVQGGDFDNIVIFQDRALTRKIDISSSGNFTGYGTIYAASAEFEKTGTGTHTLQLVVGKFTRSGSGDLVINYDEDWFHKSPKLALVE